MKLWLVYSHVLSAFGFLLVHGASVTVMFKLRRERARARIHAMLDLSGSVSGIMAATLLVLLVTGVVLGFMGRYWRAGWLWTALGLFIAIYVPMSLLGRLYFERVRHAIGVPTYDDRKKGTDPPPPASGEEQAAVLAAGRPMLLALIGVGGWTIILWLMMFRPF